MLKISKNLRPLQKSVVSQVINKYVTAHKIGPVLSKSAQNRAQITKIRVQNHKLHGDDY